MPFIGASRRERILEERSCDPGYDRNEQRRDEERREEISGSNGSKLEQRPDGDSEKQDSTDGRHLRRHRLAKDRLGLRRQHRQPPPVEPGSPAREEEGHP